MMVWRLSKAKFSAGPCSMLTSVVTELLSLSVACNIVHFSLVEFISHAEVGGAGPRVQCSINSLFLTNWSLY